MKIQIQKVWVSILVLCFGWFSGAAANEVAPLAIEVTALLNDPCKARAGSFVGSISRLHRVQQTAGEVLCFYRVTFDTYSPDQTCPLGYAEAVSFYFPDLSCSAKVGNRRSGRLARQGSEMFFEFKNITL